MYNNFFKEAENRGLKNIQIAVTTIEEEEMKYVDGNKKDYIVSSNTTYKVKAERNGQTVKLTTNYLDSTIIDILLEKEKYIEEEIKDTYLTNKENNIKASALNNTNITDKFSTLESLDKLRLENKYIKHLTLIFKETNKYLTVINNMGVDLNTSSKTYEFSVDVNSYKDDKNVSEDAVLISSKDDFDFETITRNTIDNAVLKLTEEKLETRKYNVIFNSKAASRLIKLIMDGLNGELIEKDLSLFKDKLNEQIASSNLTIIEDPTNKEYPGYILFDNDGINTYRKTIIDKGILKTYFHNTKTALKAGVKPTANNFEGISTSNLYVEKGTLSYDDLVKKLDNGIIISEYSTSMSSVNYVEGNCSFQIFGYVVRDGKAVSSFEPCLMNFTITDILNKIEEVARDLTFSDTTCASGSILINDLSITSKE